jgi:hypothetical protein
MIPLNKLKFWLNNNLNVLLTGRHGVGKSSVIFQVLDELGIKYRYFSAATMDPWVDFVGAPRVLTDDKGPYLDLVLPKAFRDDDVELIIMDEYNRAPAKVRNATMELMQFKSINGRKFPNLRMVWAAVNPHDEDGEYDTDGMDPAQLDRFHVQYTVPFDVNAKYLSEKYGAQIANSAISWWRSVPEDIRVKSVSPRRLDYALQVFMLSGTADNGADLHDILPSEVNVSELEQTLIQSAGNIVMQLDRAYQSKQSVDAERLVNNPSFWRSSLAHVNSHPNLVEFFAPLLGAERVVALLHSGEYENINEYILMYPEKFPYIKDVFDNGTEDTRSILLVAAEDNPDLYKILEVDPSEVVDEEQAVQEEIKRMEQHMQKRGELVEDETVEDETVEDETVEDETVEDETVEDETVKMRFTVGANVPTSLGKMVVRPESVWELYDGPNDDGTYGAIINGEEVTVSEKIAEQLIRRSVEVHAEPLEEIPEEVIESVDDEFADLEVEQDIDMNDLQQAIANATGGHTISVERYTGSGEDVFVDVNDVVDSWEDDGLGDFDDVDDDPVGEYEDLSGGAAEDTVGELGEFDDEESIEEDDEESIEEDDEDGYSSYYGDNGDPADLERVLRKVESTKARDASKFKPSAVIKLYHSLERVLPEYFSSERQAERTMDILDSMLVRGDGSQMPMLIMMANQCIDNCDVSKLKKVDNIVSFSKTKAGQAQGNLAI